MPIQARSAAPSELKILIATLLFILAVVAVTISLSTGVLSMLELSISKSPIYPNPEWHYERSLTWFMTFVLSGAASLVLYQLGRRLTR